MMMMMMADLKMMMIWIELVVNSVLFCWSICFRWID